MQVLTNNGYKKFNGIKKKTVNSYYEIELYDGTIIKCTENHEFMTTSGLVMACNLNNSLEIETVNGYSLFKRKRKIRKKLEVYDLIDVGGGNLYYTDGVLSHNCEFLGSSVTLIEGRKIFQLSSNEPIVEQQYLKIYEQPVKGNKYVLTVDVSSGIGEDYSVISVIDVTTSPYKQVMVYRNNEIIPTKFADVIYPIAIKYNNAFTIVESNNDGVIVCNDLYDMELENLVTTAIVDGENKIKGGRKASNGIKMTKRTKRIGCSRLKDLVETDVLLINDEETISEFSSFVKKGDSYGAEIKKHDDIVMTLVMFAWFTTTDYFTDLNNLDTNKMLKESRYDDDVTTLLGFISDGDEYNDMQFQSSFW